MSGAGLSPSVRIGLGVAALLLITRVAYEPSMQNLYIWDDDDYLTQNAAVRDPGGLSRIWLELGATHQYYPMVFTSFWVEYRLWGLQPIGYHTVNALLHGASACLLWRVLATLSWPGAGLAAALFALHPVQVESVAWITERKNVLSGLFYFASMACYLRWDASNRRSRWLYAAALALFGAALLSKTITATLPVALLTIGWWRSGLRRRDLLGVAPLLAAAAPIGGLTIWMERHVVGAQGAAGSLSAVERCLLAGRALWFYLGKLAWPYPLTFIYPRWDIEGADLPSYAYPLSAGAVIAALFMLRLRIGRAPFALAALFVITLGPALGFVDVFPFRYSFVADHFQYLASAWPLAGAAALLTLATRRLGPSARVALAAILLLMLAGRTRAEQPKYHDDVALWSDTLAKNPRASIAHNNLGVILARAGRLACAERHFEKVLAISPRDTNARANLDRVRRFRAGAIRTKAPG